MFHINLIRQQGEFPGIPLGSDLFSVHRRGWDSAFTAVWKLNNAFRHWTGSSTHSLWLGRTVSLSTFFLSVSLQNKKGGGEHNTKWKSINILGMVSPVKIRIDKRAKTVKTKTDQNHNDRKMLQFFESVKVSPVALCSSQLPYGTFQRWQLLSWSRQKKQTDRFEIPIQL